MNFDLKNEFEQLDDNLNLVKRKERKIRELIRNPEESGRHV
jgi:hypothetical protein